MPTRIAANGDVIFVEDTPPGQANPVMAQPVSGYQSGGAAYQVAASSIVSAASHADAAQAVPVGEPQSQDQYGREQPDIQNMLCQCCCPCCTGPRPYLRAAVMVLRQAILRLAHGGRTPVVVCTWGWSERCGAAARNWLTTFVGLLCLVQAGLYFAMVGAGEAQKIPDNTLVDFGGIDAPRRASVVQQPPAEPL